MTEARRAKHFAFNAAMLAASLIGWITQSGKAGGEMLAFGAGVAVINCVWMFPTEEGKS